MITVSGLSPTRAASPRAGRFRPAGRLAGRLTAGAALSALLSACAGLNTLSAVTEPTDLYDLTPKSTFSSDLPKVRSQIVVDVPTATSYVNTNRIPVKSNEFKVEYFPVARWADGAPQMVQTLLIESLENTGAVESVGREAIGLTSDYTLFTELREFQALAPPEGEGPVSVNVQLNLKIVAEPEGLIIASESFERLIPSPSNDMIDVVRSFDVALGKTMRAAVEWTVRTIAAQPRRQRY